LALSGGVGDEVDGLEEADDAVGGAAQTDEDDDSIPTMLVARLLAKAPIRPRSLASITRKTRVTGSNTVARTLAFSTIESSGAPGIRMTTAARAAVSRLVA